MPKVLASNLSHVYLMTVTAVSNIQSLLITENIKNQNEDFFSIMFNTGLSCRFTQKLVSRSAKNYLRTNKRIVFTYKL